MIYVGLFLTCCINYSLNDNIKEVMEEYAAIHPSKDYLIRFFSIGGNNYAEICRMQYVAQLPYDGYVELDNKTFYYYCVNNCFIPRWIKQNSQIYQDNQESSDEISEFFDNNNTIYKKYGKTFEKVDEQEDVFVTTPKAVATDCIRSKAFNRILNKYINQHFSFSYYLMFENIEDKTFVSIGVNEFYDSDLLDSYFIRNGHYVFIYGKDVLSPDYKLFEEDKLLKNKNKIELKAAKSELIPIFSTMQKFKIVAQETFIEMENPFVY